MIFNRSAASTPEVHLIRQASNPPLSMGPPFAHHDPQVPRLAFSTDFLTGQRAYISHALIMLHTSLNTSVSLSIPTISFSRVTSNDW